MSRRKRGLPTKKQVLLFTEGDTEASYFSLLKQRKRASALIIKKIAPSGCQIVDMAEQYVNNNPSIKDSTFATKLLVIDKDALTFDEFNHIVAQAQKKNWKLIFSNCCFEVWLLAHFRKMTKSILSCKKLEEKLSVELNMPYKKADMSQLNKIIDRWEDAVTNTKLISEISYHQQCTNVSVAISELA